MRRIKLLGLVLAGVTVPAALAIGAYVLSDVIGASASVAPVPAERVHRADQDDGPRSGRTRASPTPEASVTPTGGIPERCLEPEHAGDPTCASSSGPGGGAESGSDDRGGSSGSTSSGGGSGSSGTSGSSGSFGPSRSSDSSGSGSSGSDSSGSGGGDD